MFWIFTLTAVAAVLLAGVVLIGLAARRAGRNVESERERSAHEADAIRSAVTALQAQIAELRHGAVDVQPGVKGWVPAPVLTADQRAGALEMLRNGAAASAVCGALRLSHPETALLQKVQKMLSPVSSPN